MDSGSVTSVGTAIARPPVDPISDATSLRGSGRRPDTTTANPSPARASAAARPTPVPPPVTTATFAASPSALIRSSPSCPDPTADCIAEGGRLPRSGTDSARDGGSQASGRKIRLGEEGLGRSAT